MLRNLFFHFLVKMVENMKKEAYKRILEEIEKLKREVDELRLLRQASEGLRLYKEIRVYREIIRHD